MRKHKLKARDVNQTVGVIAVLLFAFFLWQGFDQYYTGYHNIDLVWNAVNTGVFNFTSIDVNSDLHGRTLVEGYINGMNQTRTSIMFFFMSALELMSGIYLLTWR